MCKIIKEEKIMKKVYVSPEVEYINFYSEETMSSDWDNTDEGSSLTPSVSVVGNQNGWT